MGFVPRKSKSGFTLIELLIVIVILAIMAGVVVMTVGGVFANAKSAAYNAVKNDLQNAIIAYAADHQGDLPINSSNASQLIEYNTNCSSTNPCYVINMSALLATQRGVLRKIPDGTRPDNCYGGATGCSDTNHYTWGMTTTGAIYSRCDANNASCPNGNASGYRGVWP
jgi:prepilin-type N-terminal cleavage/methylation domain-containing protein